MTSSDLQKECQMAAGVKCTARTVCNRLLEAGLKSLKARIKSFINVKQRRARMKVAKNHKDWTIEDWSKKWHKVTQKQCERLVESMPRRMKAVIENHVYLTPEEQLRRLAYCMKLLPSPLYKKERLMPTNPEAQRRFAVRDEERPAPSINIRAREERKREEEVTLREMLAYLDEEEDEKEEKEEEEMAAKIKLDIRLPRSSTRRSRTRPHNVRHQVSQASPMTWKNIMWTILLGPLCRYIGIIGPPRVQTSTTNLIDNYLANYFKEKIDHIQQEIFSQSPSIMTPLHSCTSSSSLSAFEPVSEEEVIRLLADGNQGKHRVTKRGPALSYPMFTLVTSEDIAESASHTPIQRCQRDLNDQKMAQAIPTRPAISQQGPDRCCSMQYYRGQSKEYWHASGQTKYACAGAVAEDQKRTSWNEDGRRRSGPETPIRPDQQRDRPWVTSGAYLQHYRML
ncbi:unnamed protein product [Ranitomeya imitator]|uniref:Transposase Tc1-like domain-containing protein n=1 Tax=Ranitomeya imitator TaxID=111125 RepID=A0ABN9M806_9NEOB|nr:unnamed protein product [Ranitomeya imitator]